MSTEPRGGVKQRVRPHAATRPAASQRPGTKSIKARQAGRPEQRAGTQDRRRAVTFAVLLLALLLLGGLLGGGLRVRRVDVVGANLPITAIAQAAGVNGENLLAVESDQVVRRVDAISYVAVDHVTTVLPDKVVIYARLRPAVAVWQRQQGLFLLAADGTVMTKVGSSKLPIIRGGSRAPGSGILTAANYAVRTLTSVPSGAVSAFLIDPKGLAILGQQGWRAELGRGSAQTLVIRVATLKALLIEVASRGRQLAFADLRFKQPYAKLR